MRDSKMAKFIGIAAVLCMLIPAAYNFTGEVAETIRSTISIEQTDTEIEKTDTDDFGDKNDTEATASEVDSDANGEADPDETVDEDWVDEIDLTCVEPMHGNLFNNYDTIESTTGDIYWNSIFAGQYPDGESTQATWYLGEDPHYTRFESDIAVGHASRDDKSHQAKIIVEVSRNDEDWKTIYMTEPIKNTTRAMVISGEIPEGTRYIKITATSDTYGVNCFYLCSNYFRCFKA